MSHSSKLKDLGERFNELRNKQSTLKGLLEAKEKEKKDLHAKLIEMGFAESDLTEEKASEMSNSIDTMLEDFEGKLDSWEKNLAEIKSKLL